MFKSEYLNDLTDGLMELRLACVSLLDSCHKVV